MLLLMAITSCVQASNDCPVSSPCNCFANVIDCSSRGLTTLSVFTTVSKRLPTIIMSFHDNNISVIPNSAFSALKNLGIQEVTLLLSNNQINTIQDDAFVGIEDTIKEIDAENNRLTRIPPVFGKMSSLHTLQMKGNPLETITVSNAMGEILSTFSFSAESLMQWPSDLSKMSGLNALDVNGIAFTSLDTDAFHGLEDGLQKLSIYHSKLTSIPDAICNLKSLEMFEFSNNMQISDSMITPLCSKPMLKIVTVSIHDNNLKSFPNIMSTFPNVKYLTVSGNPDLFFIPTELVETNYLVLELNLENNNFDSIPNVVRQFRKLTELNMRNNLIRVVRGSMFDNLQELKTIKLGDNPLSHIDTPAFTGLTALSHLDLSQTKLSSIPKAVTSLPKLDYLDLEENAMTCTCDLTADADWSQMNDVTILGYCSDTTMSIQTYVRHYLGLC